MIVAYSLLAILCLKTSRIVAEVSLFRRAFLKARAAATKAAKEAKAKAAPRRRIRGKRKASEFLDIDINDIN